MFGVALENVQNSRHTLSRSKRGEVKRTFHSRGVINEEDSEQGRKTRVVQRVAVEGRRIVNVADDGGIVICSMRLRKNPPGSHRPR